MHLIRRLLTETEIRFAVVSALIRVQNNSPNADAISRPPLLFSPRRHSPKVVSPSLDLMHATRKGDEQRRRGDRHAKASERAGSRAARFVREERGGGASKNARCWMLDAREGTERQRPPPHSLRRTPQLSTSLGRREREGGSKSSFPSPNNAES